MSFLFDLIRNLIYVICPLTIYLAFKKENSDILLTLSLVVAVFLQVFYLDRTFKILLYLPLLIACVKNKKTSIYLLEFMLFFIEFWIYKTSIYFIIITLIGIILIYYGCMIKRMSKYLFDILYLYMVFITSFDVYFHTIDCAYYLTFVKLFLVSLIGYFITTIFLNKLNNKEINYYISELNHEKELKHNLFTITHEIKNPIAVCKGYLDMIDLKNSKKVNKYIPIIKGEIDRTIILLDDFMNLSKLKVDKDIMDINLLLEETTNSLEYLFKDKNIKTEFEISDEEIYIMGDYNRLKQVLINLLKNAYEALGENEENIIGLKVNECNNQVIITIYDNGIGMTKEELESIETSYYTTKRTGNGLGLFFVKEIIRLHDGKLELQSKKNMGTNVIIKLNLYKC